MNYNKPNRLRLRSDPRTDIESRDHDGQASRTGSIDSFEPIIPKGEPINAMCPKCNGCLRMGIIHDLWKVCFCNLCQGYLIDSGCLQVMAHDLRMAYNGVDDQPRPIAQIELAEQRACPACEQLMETHPYFGAGNIVINSCSPCRLTWMDEGELGIIIRAPGLRPEPGSSAVVPNVTHIPNDPFTDVLGDVGRVVIRSLRGFV
jgi:Zn-finger nucleic acid-binding protein